MAEFDLIFRDEINLTPAGSGMFFEHGEFNLNLRELDFVPAGSDMFFEHPEHNVNLVVVGGVVDLLPPEITNITPTAGTNIANTQTIEFDVNDDKNLRLVAIAISFPDGTCDLAYDGTSLQGHYSASPNEVTTIVNPEGPNGKHFKLLRRGGWPGSPTIKYMALDLLNDAVIP